MLHHWSGQTDMIVCTPVTGRHRAQSREVVGYCNNILPIRVDLSGDPTLAELLGRVKAVTLAAYKNQDVPFERIAAAPGLKRIPLSRLLFSLDMPWPPDFRIDGLDGTPLRIETGAADFDLSVSLWPQGAGLQGSLRYKTSQFSEGRAETIAEAYRAALSALVQTPDLRLSDLDLGGGM
jgi:non-ribosomal peptide synthetase component F